MINNYYASPMYTFWNDSDKMYKKERLYISSSYINLQHKMCIISNKIIIDNLNNIINEKKIRCIKIFPTNDYNNITNKIRLHLSNFLILSNTFFDIYNISYTILYRIIKYIENNYDDDKFYTCINKCIVDDNKLIYNPYSMINMDIFSDIK